MRARLGLNFSVFETMLMSLSSKQNEKSGWGLRGARRNSIFIFALLEDHNDFQIARKLKLMSRDNVYQTIYGFRDQSLMPQLTIFILMTKQIKIECVER